MLFLGLAACATTDRASTTPPAPEQEHGEPPAAPASANPWAEPAREVLVQHCGRCHRSDLDTSLAGALAVYDLTRPVWYATLRPDQYDGILERVREAGAVGPDSQ